MKKLILLLTINAITNIAFSQDNIVLKNGDEINAKISEVGESNIKNKKFNNLDGPIYTKSKDEIFYIKYSNGEKEMFLDNVNNKSSNTNLNKKIIISGATTFNYTNTFENDNFYSSSNLNLTLGAGGFLTRNFLLGISLSFQSESTNGVSADAKAISPYIRGYYNDFYSQVAYAFGDIVNAFSVGVGYQIFLNHTKSFSLNPGFLYFDRKYKNLGPDLSQDGILIGCALELHL